MSTAATGRILDEVGDPLPNLTVEVRHGSAIYPVLLDSAPPGPDGRFSLSYVGENPAFGLGARTLIFRVLDEVKRVVEEFKKEDVAERELSLGDRTITRARARGFLVTLDKDTPARVSDGNKIESLVDGVDAFGRVAELIRDAKKSILIKQLFLAVPKDFEPDPADEKPALIFDFEPFLITFERQLIQKVLATPGIDVRILLNHPQLHPIAAILLFYSIIGIYGLYRLDGTTHVPEVQRYFGASPAEINARGFRQRLPDGVMHGKLVLVDGEKAICLGSPMTQSYFDESHIVENPHRGAASGYPQHDVSIAVEGPAVAALHESFRLHWNEEAESEDDKLDPIEPPAEVSGSPDEIATLQVVRTLSDRRFDDPKDGEKGILEAYLRAIREARELIYLENQYFTNDAISDALGEVIRDAGGRPNLQVILLLNIEPDVITYPTLQCRHITALRKLVPKPAPERPRFGVFTRWAHEIGTAERPRPRIVPTYVHAKVGIVDRKWATIGSANLDGLSLDANWLLSKLVPGESRATETNLLILNGADGKPPTGAVDLLRRKLFTEHLEVDQAGDATPPEGGWLKLWQSTADEKLRSLREDPTRATVGHVLPFPPGNTTHTRPRAQMRALGIDISKIDPLKKVATFELKDGTPKEKPKVDPPPYPPPGLAGFR